MYRFLVGTLWWYQITNVGKDGCGCCLIVWEWIFSGQCDRPSVYQCLRTRHARSGTLPTSDSDHLCTIMIASVWWNWGGGLRQLSTTFVRLRSKPLSRMSGCRRCRSLVEQQKMLRALQEVVSLLVPSTGSGGHIYTFIYYLIL